MATKATAKKEASENQADTPEGPLLDLNNAEVKKMIKAAKMRGYVTYDQLNKVMPSDEVTSEQIEDTMSMLSEMGINVVEDDEEETESEGGELVEATKSSAVTTTKKKEPTDRTDDPVRMYLREMGSVELLSREGEIAIAKRIEAGREAMIAGLCESPLTFQAIIIWRDELAEEKILLRDIIDLEATYAGPDAKNVPSAPTEEEKKEEEEKKAEAENAESLDADNDDEDDDDDDMENSISLAAMEAELKPEVVEKFDDIASNYAKLRKLQDKLVESKLADKKQSKADGGKMQELREQIEADVKSLSLNQHRIEALVEQLYDINKRLIGFEGRLLRLAESYGVKREQFIEHYQGSELDPNWLDKITGLKGRGWKEFSSSEPTRIGDLRGEIQMLASETGLETIE
ncbi:MAG: RNA polymerase sigma factor region1.1 domain-containing protein, partial [Hyphomicrobiales bacterium]